MADSFVERKETPVLRLLADFRGAGPSAAFRSLEAKLPTLRGRHFYGEFRWTPSGPVYHACVERIDTDDPTAMGLEVGSLAGGLYVRRRLDDWPSKISRLPQIVGELIAANSHDTSRPTLEYYRSRTELDVLLPVSTRGPK